MNEIARFFSGGVIGGLLLSLFITYLFSKIKDKIDFSEKQKEINHELDKRITVLERLNKDK